MSTTIRTLAIVVATLLLLAVVAIGVSNYRESLPTDFQTHRIKLPNGGTIRNETWYYHDYGWGGDSFPHGSVHYDSPDMQKVEEIVAPGPDGRNFRLVVAAAYQHEEMIDFLFGDTLYQRVDSTWTKFELSSTEIVPLHYVPIPPAASVDRWEFEVGPPDCSVQYQTQHHFPDHWVLAMCAFHRYPYPYRATPVRFHRDGFGQPWSLDKLGTFAQTPPQQTQANWPGRVTWRLDIYQMPSGATSDDAKSESKTELPTTGQRLARYEDSFTVTPTGETLQAGIRIGGAKGAAILYPTALDSLGNPVFLWLYYPHGSHTFDLRARRVLRSQEWGRATQVARFMGLVDGMQRVPLAVYLTLIAE